jgi:hypothetical protein
MVGCSKNSTATKIPSREGIFVAVSGVVFFMIE